MWRLLCFSVCAWQVGSISSDMLLKTNRSNIVCFFLFFFHLLMFVIAYTNWLTNRRLSVSDMCQVILHYLPMDIQLNF